MTTITDNNAKSTDLKHGKAGSKLHKLYQANQVPLSKSTANPWYKSNKKEVKSAGIPWYEASVGQHFETKKSGMRLLYTLIQMQILRRNGIKKT
jgi:hypothetical protein